MGLVSRREGARRGENLGAAAAAALTHSSPLMSNTALVTICVASAYLQVWGKRRQRHHLTLWDVLGGAGRGGWRQPGRRTSAARLTGRQQRRRATAAAQPTGRREGVLASCSPPGPSPAPHRALTGPTGPSPVATPRQALLLAAAQAAAGLGDALVEALVPHRLRGGRQQAREGGCC